MQMRLEAPQKYNADNVKMICNNDIAGLKQAHSNGTPITFSDYLNAIRGFSL